VAAVRDQLVMVFAEQSVAQWAVRLCLGRAVFLLAHAARECNAWTL